jgi:uncharacterized protein YbjQ (UPF0145 family)
VSQRRGLIITTTDGIEGRTVVRTVGLVTGSTIRARHLGRDVMAGLRNVVGGEVKDYTKLMAESREQAIDRMIASAAERGANGIINVRFSTSYIMNSASEILVYGDAVVLEPE